MLSTKNTLYGSVIVHAQRCQPVAREQQHWVWYPNKKRQTCLE